MVSPMSDFPVLFGVGGLVALSGGIADVTTTRITEPKGDFHMSDPLENGEVHRSKVSKARYKQTTEYEHIYILNSPGILIQDP